MAAFLTEAPLPFACSLGPAALMEHTTLLRCCRGLRPKIWEQRVACWRPFRRQLLAHGHGPQPKSLERVLDCFGFKAEEGLVRTTLPSPLVALRFLEAAGGAKARRLAKHPSVANPVREHPLEADQCDVQKESTRPCTQAPLLLLYFMGELEGRGSCVIGRRPFGVGGVRLFSAAAQRGHAGPLAGAHCLRGFREPIASPPGAPSGTQTAVLLTVTSSFFLTERSDRAGLDGWCMALGVWEPKGSSLGC